MFKEYVCTPYATGYDASLLLIRKDNSFVFSPKRLSTEELLKALKGRYHFSEQQVNVTEFMDKPRIHVLAADNNPKRTQGKGKDNLTIIKEEVAQWGYSVSDISEQLTFHNIPFIHIVLELQNEYQ